ncbi:MAG: hypothetical protein ACSHX7_00250 [Luteolibacter sp.]
MKLSPRLPNGQMVLREIREKASKYLGQIRRGGSEEAKQILRPYFWHLKALVMAARQKLSVAICLPNNRNWDRRAFQFYQELQLNLGKMKRVHFITLTFAGDFNYKEIRKMLKNFTGNQLYRADFESVEVVAYHPDSSNEGRLHVHLLAWSKYPRSARMEKSLIDRIISTVRSSKLGIGISRSRAASGIAAILRSAAYMAWNYSRTLSQSRDEGTPIPKGARVLSRPKNVLPERAWQSVGKLTLITPTTTAWRRAVGKFAKIHHLSPKLNRQWVWRQRRLIRKLVEQETWWETSVTGLDGYSYLVIPAGRDHLGNETYLLSNEERGGFYLTEHGLEKLAKYEVLPEALEKNCRFDLTTGDVANCYETLGMNGFLQENSA